MSEVKRWWASCAFEWNTGPCPSWAITPRECKDPQHGPFVLASDYGAVVKERDLVAKERDAWKAQVESSRQRAEAAEATVEKVRALSRHFGAYVHPRTTLFVECRDLDRALAGEAREQTTCALCHEGDWGNAIERKLHGYGRCTERRKRDLRGRP